MKECLSQHLSLCLYNHEKNIEHNLLLLPWVINKFIEIENVSIAQLKKINSRDGRSCQAHFSAVTANIYLSSLLQIKLDPRVVSSILFLVKWCPRWSPWWWDIFHLKFWPNHFIHSHLFRLFLSLCLSSWRTHEEISCIHSWSSFPNQDTSISFSALKKKKKAIYLTDHSSNNPFTVLQTELIFDWYKRMGRHQSLLPPSVPGNKNTGKLKHWRTAKVVILNSEENIHSELTGANKKHLLLLLPKSRVWVPSISMIQPSKTLNFTIN